MKKFTAFIVAGLLSVAVAGPTMSQGMLSGADAIAKRKEVMQSNGATLRAAGAATGADAIAAGQTLVDNFAMLVDLFPADSQTGATRAKPEIWTDSAGFTAALSTAATSAAAILTAAKAGDMAAYTAAVGAMGGACGGCHNTYRGPAQ